MLVVWACDKLMNDYWLNCLIFEQLNDLTCLQFDSITFIGVSVPVSFPFLRVFLFLLSFPLTELICFRSHTFPFQFPRTKITLGRCIQLLTCALRLCFIESSTCCVSAAAMLPPPPPRFSGVDIICLQNSRVPEPETAPQKLPLQIWARQQPFSNRRRLRQQATELQCNSNKLQLLTYNRVQDVLWTTKTRLWTA